MLTLGSLTDRMAESVHYRHSAIVRIKGDGVAIRRHGLQLKFSSPVRKSKLSGWLRPSMMTCKVCVVVCNLSAIFSILSFPRDEFIFCCISGFPISCSVPPMNDKNLEWKEKPKFISNTTFTFSCIGHLQILFPQITKLQPVFAVISDVAEGHVGGDGVYLNSCATSQGQHLIRVGPGTFYNTLFITIQGHMHTS